VFYPTSGGQPGDSGVLNWADGKIEIATAIKGPDDTVVLVPAEPAAMPPVGTRCNFAVSDEWITEAALDANPALVKTMSVQPPRGSGHIRLVRIGQGDDTADLQPCGGTHVANTDEIGTVRIGKVEKKGKQNRRVYLHLES